MIKQRTFALMVWGLFAPILIVSPAPAAEFHVTNAAAFLDALSTCSGNGEDDTIYLAEGRYDGHFTFTPTDSRSLLITGEPETSGESIILDGQASGAVFSFGGSAGGGSVTVKGLTVQNGSESGVKVECLDGGLDLILIGLLIQNNTTSYMGGGIYIRTWQDGTADVRIRDSVIRYNRSPGNESSQYGRGGGIHVNSCYGNSTIDLVVINSLIYGNQANWTGGGLNFAASEVEDNNRTRVVIINSTITENASDMHNTGYGQGGGIYLKGYGRASVGSGGIANLDLHNTIVHGNKTVGDEVGKDLCIDQDGPGKTTANAYDCDIGDVEVSLGLYTPVHVISADPQFVNSGSDDYRLGAYSPCMDAGDNDTTDLPDTDLAGNPRISWGRVDMGAYEVPESVVYAALDSLCGGKTPCYSSIGDTMGAEGVRFIIRTGEGAFNEGLLLDEARRIDLEAGWNNTFTTLTGHTGVDSVTLRDGTFKLDKGCLVVGE